MLHEVGNDSWGRIVLDVSVNRQDHVAAINDLFVATQRLGYTLINGEVRSIVDSAIDAPFMAASVPVLLGLHPKTL